MKKTRADLRREARGNVGTLLNHFWAREPKPRAVKLLAEAVLDLEDHPEIDEHPAANYTIGWLQGLADVEGALLPDYIAEVWRSPPLDDVAMILESRDRSQKIRCCQAIRDYFEIDLVDAKTLLEALEVRDAARAMNRRREDA